MTRRARVTVSSAVGGEAPTEMCEAPTWSRMLEASCRSEHDTAKVTRFVALLLMQFYSVNFFMHPRKTDGWGEGEVQCTGMRDYSMRV